jgi:capsular polysaccharide biosynthesis protein
LTLVTGIVVWFLASLQPKVYEATALVRIQQKITTAGDAFGSLEAGTRLAQTYARIVKTDAIDQRVAAALAGLRATAGTAESGAVEDASDFHLVGIGNAV